MFKGSIEAPRYRWARVSIHGTRPPACGALAEQALCGAGQPRYDPTHFETISILKQYNTNYFMDGKGPSIARSVDSKWKKL
jgi:hypothetical protein